ncbi:MAG: type II toxin-antitoxin system RelE/ParE family toxin [Propionibacteriaceae bacterium]|nr:type II toxin-antitoxin system RelE/ParE family toxin [Propionibacteriaceae bacterium]
MTGDAPYDVTYLPLFYEDLADAVDYIARRLQNPQAADRLITAVEAAIAERQKSPAGYQPHPSTRARPYPYYPIRVKNYVVFYVLIDHVMEVRRCLYARRDLPTLL